MNKSPQELNKQVKDKMPQIIEYFVSVYGEEYRERISTRLNSTIFVFAGEKNAENGKLDKKFVNDTISFIEENGLFLGRETYLRMVDEYSEKGGLGGGIFASATFDDLSSLKLMCYFPAYEGLDNARFFHELNHIIQTDIYQKDGGVTTRSGILRSSYDIDPSARKAIFAETDAESDYNLLYEGLNEVLNDYLSLKVLKVAENDGFKISDGENIEASYAAVYPMMGSFIDGSQNTISRCMLLGKRKELVSLIGSKYIEKLADSINALLDFEDKHYEEEVEKMKVHNLDVEALLKMDKEKVPQQLRYYTSLCRNIDDIITESENESEI